MSQRQCGSVRGEHTSECGAGNYLAACRRKLASAAAEHFARPARQRITIGDVVILLVDCVEAYQEEVEPLGSVQVKSIRMLDLV